MKTIAKTLVIAAAVLIAAWFAFGDLLAPPQVETCAVVQGDAVSAVYGSGTAEPVRTLTIRAPASGTWTGVTANEGDRVEVEQVLGQVRVPGLTQDLARAQVDLDAAEERESVTPGVRALRAESAAVAARIELAQLELDRSSALVERGIGDARSVDRLRTELAGLQANASALRAQRRDAEQGTDEDTERQRILVQRAREMIENTSVRAPFAGHVLERFAEPSEWVQQGTPLMRLGDLTALHVEAEIDESDVDSVAVGSAAVLSFFSVEGERFDAVVTEISTDADRTRGTFAVELALSEPVEGLRPGQSAEVNIVTARVEDVPLVPNAALDADRVWQIRDGRLEEVRPEWGVRGTTHTEVRGGLDAGALLVLRPAADLRAGMRVRASEPR